jgi:outer membrane receptor for ferrienterochelin and colicin
VNAGYISRQAQFGAVFPNYGNDINEDLENEEIISFEAGYGYTSNNLRINVNAYSTTWGNRFQTVSLSNANGVDGTLNSAILMYVTTVSSLKQITLRLTSFV